MFYYKKDEQTKAHMVEYSGPLCPQQHKKLEKAKRDNFKWSTLWIGDHDRQQYEVIYGGIKVSVDLDTQSCTCRVWDLSGVPCEHACAAICFKNMATENFVHPFFVQGQV